MAVKGNKYALGNSGGLPTYTRDDVIAIGKDLEEWSKDPGSLKFTFFAASRHLNLQRFSEWEDKYQEFAESYEYARANLDQNRFHAARTDQMPESWYAKNERVYDTMHDRHHKRDLAYESKLKTQEVKAISDADIARFESLENQLNEVRKVKKSINKKD